MVSGFYPSIKGSPIIYSAKSWKDALARTASDSERSPKPEDVPLPEAPSSVRRWTDEEIRADTGRIINNPSHLDRIRAFSQFVNAESHNLVRYGGSSGFCV